MKKIFTAFLLAIICFSLLGVTKNGNAANSSDYIVLKGDKETVVDAIYIVYHSEDPIKNNYPEEQNSLVKEYAKVFAQRLQEIVNCPVYETEFESQISENSYCIIYIGEEYNNRFYIEELKAQNGGMIPFVPSSEEWRKFCGSESIYSIYVDDLDIHVNASDEWALYWAIDKLLKEVELAETFVLNDKTEPLLSENYPIPDPTELLNKDKKPYLKKMEIAAILPHDGDFADFPHNMQGGTVVGDYAYYGIDGNSDYGVLFKYYIPDWTLVDYEENVFFRHANDLSYIEDENLIIASHCRSGNSNIFSYIDTETLEVVGTKELSWNFWAMEYDENTGKYIAEGNWTNYILDKDFNILKEMPYGNTDGVCQSLYIDEDFIYDVRWDLGGKSKTGLPWNEHWEDGHFENYIYVHNYENVCIERIPLPYEILGEPENMFRYNNFYYVGYIGDVVKGEIITYGKIYKMILLPEIWWEN